METWSPPNISDNHGIAMFLSHCEEFEWSVCMCACVCMCVHVCVRVCMCVYMHICRYVQKLKCDWLGFTCSCNVCILYNIVTLLDACMFDI